MATVQASSLDRYLRKVVLLQDGGGMTEVKGALVKVG